MQTATRSSSTCDRLIVGMFVMVAIPSFAAQPEFGTPKPITTINDASVAVWSPALTPDGLELYYTHWNESGEWDVHWASRSSLDGAFYPEGPVPALVRPGKDDNVTFTPDGLTLIYGSNVGGVDYDLFASERPSKNDPWGAPYRLDFVSSDRSEGAPSMSADGLELYFGGGWAFDGALWVAKRDAADAPWSDPVVVPGFEDQPLTLNFPAISHDGLKIVYHNAVSGTPDLWIATRDTTSGPFGGHVALSEEINTPNIDSFAYLAPDDTLFFTRNAVRRDSGWDLYHTGTELQFHALDFDKNAAVNVVDLDALCAAMAQQRYEDHLDVTSDGVIDGGDLARFLDEIGTVAGDADLDADVDFVDFLALSRRFGIAGRRWSRGDFNCDGQTDFTDFSILSARFGYQADADGAALVRTVPEPGFTFPYAALGVVVLSARRRRRMAAKTCRLGDQALSATQ